MPGSGLRSADTELFSGSPCDTFGCACRWQTSAPGTGKAGCWAGSGLCASLSSRPAFPGALAHFTGVHAAGEAECPRPRPLWSSEQQRALHPAGAEQPPREPPSGHKGPGRQRLEGQVQPRDSREEGRAVPTGPGQCGRQGPDLNGREIKNQDRRRGRDDPPTHTLPSVGPGAPTLSTDPSSVPPRGSSA